MTACSHMDSALGTQQGTEKWSYRATLHDDNTSPAHALSRHAPHLRRSTQGTWWPGSSMPKASARRLLRLARSHSASHRSGFGAVPCGNPRRNVSQHSSLGCRILGFGYRDQEALQFHNLSFLSAFSGLKSIQVFPVGLYSPKYLRDNSCLWQGDMRHFTPARALHCHFLQRRQCRCPAEKCDTNILFSQRLMQCAAHLHAPAFYCQTLHDSMADSLHQIPSTLRPTTQKATTQSCRPTSAEAINNPRSPGTYQHLLMTR